MTIEPAEAAAGSKPINAFSPARKKTLCIDLRWIDASGVGMYIQGIMPGIVESLSDVSIVGLGERTRLEKFPWASAENVRSVDCNAKRYSIAEQVQVPLAIPRGVDLFFSPYYTIPLLYRGRFAVTVHDMSHRVVPEIVSNPRKRLYAQWMFRELRRRASVIFTVSEFSKSELLRLTRGPREDNIFPTHLGVSPEWYHAAELPPTRLRPYFVCVGNVKPYKNLGRLVDAFLSICDRVPHDLVIVGQSAGLITGESSEFFKKIDENKDRVHLSGFVSHEELLSLVGNACALVMPSLYEGFGLPPVEAMAAGVPVAVSKAASLPEICGDAALYFDPFDVGDMGEKLVQIASDTVLRTRFRQRGLERSRRYTWNDCAELTAAKLRDTLGLKGFRGSM
jgi:glycosyltransferase involved in cell wall biosynthesis